MPRRLYLIVLLVILVLLLISIYVASKGRDPRQQQRKEAFFGMSASPLLAPSSDVLFAGYKDVTVGKPSCVNQPIPVSPFDEFENQQKSCENACAARPDVMTAYGGISVTDQNVVQCQCCDPRKRVTLRAHLENSKPCAPDVNFYTSNDSLFVNDGCRGIFSWQDDRLVRCEAPMNTVTSCRYARDTPRVADLRATPEETLRTLAERNGMVEVDMKERAIAQAARGASLSNTLFRVLPPPPIPPPSTTPSTTPPAPSTSTSSTPATV